MKPGRPSPYGSPYERLIAAVIALPETPTALRADMPESWRLRRAALEYDGTSEHSLPGSNDSPWVQLVTAARALRDAPEDTDRAQWDALCWWVHLAAIQYRDAPHGKRGKRRATA